MLVTNAVAKLSWNHKLSVILVNTTGKILSLKRGTPVAKINPIYTINICCSVDKSIVDISRQRVVSPNTEFVNLDAPPINKQQAIKMLRKNREICAETDIDLSRTDTIIMKMYTCNHSAIKLRPCRTQLNNRKVIDIRSQRCL